jgi:hypothetical protein
MPTWYNDPIVTRHMLLRRALVPQRASAAALAHSSCSLLTWRPPVAARSRYGGAAVGGRSSRGCEPSGTLAARQLPSRS